MSENYVYVVPTVSLILEPSFFPIKKRNIQANVMKFHISKGESWESGYTNFQFKKLKNKENIII